MNQSFIEKCRARQIGKKASIETKLKMSMARMGVKKRYSAEARERIAAAHRGEKSHWWQGGKTSERQRIYNSLEYRVWRRKIFERDGYRCRKCRKKGGDLQADHIKPFALFQELRFAIDNGRTLCVPCHRSTPTYGWKLSNKTRRR